MLQAFLSPIKLTIKITHYHVYYCDSDWQDSGEDGGEEARVVVLMRRRMVMMVMKMIVVPGEMVQWLRTFVLAGLWFSSQDPYKSL